MELAAMLQTGPGDAGIDTTLVVSMVTALVGTISALAGLIYRQLRSQLDQCAERCRDLEDKLDGYRDITPEMIEAIRERLDLDSPPHTGRGSRR